MSAKKDSSKPSAKRTPRTKRPIEGTAAAPEAAGVSQAPTMEQIRTRAYEIYRSGRNPSDPVADWFQAERELRNGARA